MWMLWTLAIALIGQIIFIYGFLPITMAGRNFTEDRPLPTSINGIRVNSDLLYKPVINKLVLLIIDALRDDFITGSDAARHMSYLSSLLEDGKGVHFTSLVEPPTVTLPRIKAITMGTIPNYADIVLNVLEKESNSSKEDSFIGRASSKKLNTVFYGDDTWLRLFPNSFLRSEGTSSFYVSDFNEVDDNVTRHLDHELQQDDWDIMILHYLGLDHIGHVHGPYSKLMPPKLQEMDDVIKKLHLGLKAMGHSSLLVICGDHGMKDTGGHGGATYSETHVPLIFVSPTSNHSLGHCKKSHNGNGIINQRDLASTLSALLGLQPPSMNLGSAIPCILRIFISKVDAYLYALHVNAWQVASLFDSAHDSTKDWSHLFEMASGLHSDWIKLEKNWMKSMDGNSSQDDLIKDITEKYVVSISQMTSKLAASLVNFDYYTMLVGVVITWQAFIISVMRKETTTFQNDLMKTLIWFIIILVLHFSICFFGSCFIPDSSLCRYDLFTFLTVFFLSFVISLNTLEILEGYHSLKISLIQGKWKIDSSSVNNMIIFGTLLHVISLFSSSFIEEEHQTWQFLCISLIILIGMTVCHTVPPPNLSHVPTRRYNSFLSNVQLGCSHKLKDQNVHLMSVLDNKTFAHQRKEWLNFIAVLFIHRFLRDYNRTGDKWGNLSDIGDWMSESENIGIRSAVMAMSLFGITFFLIINSTIKFLHPNGIFLVLVSLCTYAYRAAIGDVSTFNLYPTSRGITEFHLVLIFMILILASGCYEAFKVLTHDEIINIENFHEEFKERELEQPLLNAFVVLTHELCKFWVILCTSLNRPGDVPIMLAFLFFCKVLANSIMKTGRFNAHTISKTFIWLGMVFYFFKGNSNSLASVDLKAAYTGQDYYSAVVVGILLFCHTFSMPVLAILLLFHYLAIAASRTQNLDLRSKQNIMDAAVTSVITSRLFPVVFYLPFIILQRHHLFIWTVFAPKLIYEAFFTLASLFGLSLVFILQKCLSHLAKVKKIWCDLSMNV